MKGAVPHSTRQLIDPADRPTDPKRMVVVSAATDRDSGAVIAAVLQSAQAFEQKRARLTTSDVSDDATHICLLCSLKYQTVLVPPDPKQWFKAKRKSQLRTAAPWSRDPLDWLLYLSNNFDD
jgi:hypothetical protein